MIRIRCTCQDGKVTSVEFENQPTFAYRIGVPLELDGYPTLTVDVAWGGITYVLADAAELGIAVDGFMLPGSRGQLRPHPLLTHLRALETQMTHWESVCGFIPSARAQLGYGEVARVSKLDELMAKRAQRGGSA